ENQAGGILLSLLEHVADATGTDADEHLDEVRAGNGEERNVRFAGDGAGQQRLAGAGRPNEQHALRNAPAKALELLRIAQIFDDLLQLLLRLVDASHVVERHPPRALGEEPRPGLSETH